MSKVFSNQINYFHNVLTSILHFCHLKVRALALSCINNCGHKLHPYPLAHLSKLLIMKVWFQLSGTLCVWVVYLVVLEVWKLSAVLLGIRCRVTLQGLWSQHLHRWKRREVNANQANNLLCSEGRIWVLQLLGFRTIWETNILFRAVGLECYLMNGFAKVKEIHHSPICLAL